MDNTNYTTEHRKGQHLLSEERHEIEVRLKDGWSLYRIAGRPYNTIWAKTNNLNALSLECQDNNVLASRFYKKNGFVIGGVNTELYAMLGEPYASETAVFWYKKLG